MKPNEEFGWAYSSPSAPSKECRWCGAENIHVHGVVICAKCDRYIDWPNRMQVGA